MKTEVEKLEATKVKLTVKVPYQELEGEIKKVYKEVGQQVNIPGFRPGHVPAQVLDRRVGRGYIIEQAINAKLGDFYRQAIDENQLKPLGQPEVDVTDTPNLEGKPGGDLQFSAEVEVVPDFELPNLEGVSLEVEKLEVHDEQVEQELDRLRERFASLKTVERPAENGDFTSIDMIAKIDAEEVDSVSGVSYEIGSNSMLDGMDEALAGLNAGDTKTFSSTLKGGEHEGEEAEVTVTLNSVKERELPEADDEFAEMASEFDAIGELRQDLRKGLERSNTQQQALEAREKLQDYLVDNTEMPLPSGLVDSEVKRITESQEDAKEEEVRENVEKSLKRQLINTQLADQNQVELDPNELYQSIFEISQAYGIDPMKMIQDQNQVAQMSQDLRMNKALVQALREVEVKDTEGNPVDLSEFTKDRSEQNAEAAAEASEEAEDSGDSAEDQ